MPQQELIPHLFRTEYSKISAVIARRLGIGRLAVAEDIAGEAFAAALETWTYRGVPENPVAWLYAVANNRLLNYLKRERIFNDKVAARITVSTAIEPELDLSEGNIRDCQLQMLFAVCHPAISVESQIGLALRILCGFGIDEIAGAFLSNRETIQKRLFRAREKLRQEAIDIAMPPDADIPQRLDAVLKTLYLLFNEGYYSESRKPVLQRDLCFEAMRLTDLLISSQPTALPAVKALMALMCFHASRFDARTDDRGDMILYDEQDERRWNRDLIARGAFYLKDASQGDRFSKYHLEAGIAYWHTVKTDSREKWEQILQLHNHLLVLEYSPVAALNRTYALAKVHGNQVAIEAAEKLDLPGNHYYFLLLGVLYENIDRNRALQHFEHALELAKTDADRRSIQLRISNPGQS